MIVLWQAVSAVPRGYDLLEGDTDAEADSLELCYCRIFKAPRRPV